MNLALVRRYARVMVAGFVVLIGVGLSNASCFARETAPQAAKQQEGQATSPRRDTPSAATSPKPDTPSAARLPAQTEEPQMIDGAYQVGGEVTPPVVTHSVEPNYTFKARRTKLQGLCVVALLIDEKGMPQNVHVTKSLNSGMDENAVKAVQKYRFKPATYHGQPVPVKINIEVNFRIW